MKSNMQKAIMRRVYYSYAISIGTHVMFWQGMFLGAAALLLAKWLHVASIIHNFLAVPVGNVPQYAVHAVTNAISHGEILTVLTLLLATIVAVRAGYHLAQAAVSRLWLVEVV